jgi:Ca2+-binding EF-hand superfamily protein
VKKKELEKELLELFNQIDQDGSGYIQNDEISRLLALIGLNCGGRDLEDFMSKFDSDHDGKISF